MTGNSIHISKYSRILRIIRIIGTDGLLISQSERKREKLGKYVTCGGWLLPSRTDLSVHHP